MVFWGPHNSETNIYPSCSCTCMYVDPVHKRDNVPHSADWGTAGVQVSYWQTMTPHPPAPSFPHPSNPPFHLNPCTVTQWNYIIQLLGSAYSMKTYWVTSNCNSDPTGGGVDMWDSLQVCLLDLPSSKVQDWPIYVSPTCSRHCAMVQGSQGTLSHHCFSAPQTSNPTPTPTLPLLPHPPPNKGRGAGE